MKKLLMSFIHFLNLLFQLKIRTFMVLLMRKLRIHHLLRKDLSDILSFIEKSVLLGHNIDNFDLKFLNYFLKKELPNQTIDTLNISRSKLGNKVKNHKLMTLAEYFNVVSPTHTARDDVMTTFEVYKKLSSIQ